MEYWAQMVVTVMCSVLASSGMWAFLSKKLDRKDARTELLMGIAHDRIIFLGMMYVERGYITQDEYENLYIYLYEPYKKIDGDVAGSVKRVMSEVDNLPIHKLKAQE